MVPRSTRNYQLTYPKVECRGDSVPDSLVWNDSKYCSKIQEVHLAIDSNNRINELHCSYERGTPEHLLKDRSYSSFRCRENEYIHLISGGMGEGLLDFLVLVTNHRRKIKFGVESSASAKFDFNIQDNEYPSALFGEVSLRQPGGYRVNRIGCLIDRVC